MLIGKKLLAKIVNGVKHPTVFFRLNDLLGYCSQCSIVYKPQLEIKSKNSFNLSMFR
jgi:hypothetical protein